MNNGMNDEFAMTVAMVLAAIWTALSGDTLVPSLAGSCFAVYFRLTKPHNNGTIAWIDMAGVFAMSMVVGMIGGPYLADQMPEGQGVIGVGALVASFMGAAGFTKLHDLKWDVGAFIAAIIKPFLKKD